MGSVGSGKELSNFEQFGGPIFLTFWHLLKHTFEKKCFLLHTDAHLSIHVIVHTDQMSIMNFEDTFLQTCITFECFLRMILRSVRVGFGLVVSSMIG